MQAPSLFRPVLRGVALVLAVSLLTACEGGFGETGFQAQYVNAREALEKGHYDKANKRYESLIPQAGPLENRIRLEYAHSLLRSGYYTSASQQARHVANNEQGEARAAALSVLGTAEHEMALVALNQNEGPAAKKLLLSAQSTMREVRKTHPELDPLGALTERLAEIKQLLRSL